MKINSELENNKTAMSALQKTSEVIDKNENQYPSSVMAKTLKEIDELK